MIGRPRLTDPRAGALCTSCNRRKPETPKPHCTSPTCPWWRCEACRADNDSTGSNSLTNRDGTSRTPPKGDTK